MGGWVARRGVDLRVREELVDQLRDVRQVRRADAIELPDLRGERAGGRRRRRERQIFAHV